MIALGADAAAASLKDLHNTVFQEHLTHIELVNTARFVLFWDAEIKSGNLVKDGEEDVSDCKGVTEDGTAAGELVAELDVISAHPASWDYRVTIESGNVIGSKETSKDVSHETSNTVNGKHIEAVIDSE